MSDTLFDFTLISWKSCLFLSSGYRLLVESNGVIMLVESFLDAPFFQILLPFVATIVRFAVLWPEFLAHATQQQSFVPSTVQPFPE